jgi:hypothetical protein
MNHPSKCTIGAMHDYFNDGTLPAIGAVCAPDKTGFQVALEAIAAQTGETVDK